MSKDTDWFTQYDDDPKDDFDDRSRPPIWVVIVVVVSVVVGGWLLATQTSTDGDAVAGTTIPFEPFAATTTLAATSTTDSVATTLTVAPVDVSVFDAAPTAPSPQELRGYVAVTSPDASSSPDTVWVYQPGGSIVSTADNDIGRSNARYPMLITAGHLIVGNQIFDIDLAEPPISLWTDVSVYPGSGPGVVWLARRQGPGRFSVSDWVSPVDVESLTVGEQVDLTDVGVIPVVGVADGLVVGDPNDESYVFWSPADGLVDVDLPDHLNSVLAGSGNVVVVVTRASVNVLDIVSGELVSSLELPDINRPVSSACLSPDGQHVIIVGSNGEAVVANTTTGKAVRRLKSRYLTSIQRKHGIGWTTDDQIVFINGDDGEDKDLFGFDIAANNAFHVASLPGPEEWWLAASGTMC